MNTTEDASAPKLLTDLRRDKIAEFVERNGTVTSEAIALQFGVSLMTVWRDLTSLEESHRLRRIRGGAKPLERRPETEPQYISKQVVNRKQKEAIAAYAAEHFIHDGDIIFVEAGTSVAAMAKHLERYAQLTVIGNGLGTMNELAMRLPNLTVYCCGGMLRDVGLTFVGPQAEEYFRHVNAHTCFLGCTGLAFPEGVTDPNTLEIQVKRAMAASAGRAVLLLDSTKFGVRSLARILPLEKIAVIITDDGVSPEYVEHLRTLGIDVHVAPVQSPT